jgi:hypothetical protein
MAITRILMLLTWVVLVPVGVLAQTPPALAPPTPACCADDTGDALAAAVLLPPPAPAASHSCCQTVSVPAEVGDHTAHAPAPAVKPAPHPAHGEAHRCPHIQADNTMACCGARMPTR